VSTFYSCLKLLERNGLVAFFAKDDDKKYSVGQVIGVTRTDVRVRLIDPKAKWLGYRTFRIQEIACFSWMTKYEKKLEKRAAKIRLSE